MRSNSSISALFLMFNWIFVNFLRGGDNPPLPTQETALAFLSSVVADGDIFTDWLYYNDIIGDEDIEERNNDFKWLIKLQFISCIFGTLSWLGVATDGRLVNWLRSAFYMIPWLLVASFVLPLLIIATMLEFLVKRSILSSDNCLSKAIDRALYWIEHHALKPLWLRSKQKATFSSGAILFIGILVEDIPQLIVTFMIEDKIKSDDPGGNISNAALVNLLFAIFDIMHKLAQAYDLRKDVQNACYMVKRTIRAHGDQVGSLALSGVNRILSASKDKTAKIWDGATGKCMRVFKCESKVHDAVTWGTSKVLAACKDKSVRFFDNATGALDYDFELDFIPYFVCVSPDLGSFFTGNLTLLQRWDMPTKGRPTPQLITTYRGPGANKITFLDNFTFVSCRESSRDVLVWNMNKGLPIHKLTNQGDLSDGKMCSILAMSSTTFLTGGSKGKIQTFELVDNEWISKKFKAHENDIYSLTKVNESLFVSTSWDRTAKLWDITQVKPFRVFTFQGHTCPVYSAMYLKEEQAIASGDEDGTIRIWSICDYLQQGDTDDQTSISSSVEGNFEELKV